MLSFLNRKAPQASWEGLSVELSFLGIILVRRKLSGSRPSLWRYAEAFLLK